jgi:hypothetical protein
MSLSIRQWLSERHIELTQLGHSSAQIAGIAFRIAQDMEVKSLTVFSISGLTDVLELPLKAARVAAPAISQLTVGLLRILSRKKPLRRNEGTWLTFQVAYLNALQGILEQEARVGRPWLNRAEVPAGQDADQPLSDPQLIALLKTLRPGRLSDSQAEQALMLVADSLLVQQMNNLAIAWFVANGAEETEAKLLAQRLSYGLAGYLLAVIAENPLPLAQLQKFVRLGNVGSLRDSANANTPDSSPELPTATLPLNWHREHYRASLLQSLSEPLLGEPFSLKDLYIPLKGKLLHSGVRDWGLGTRGGTYSPQSPVDLMEWAMSQLEDKTRISVIEAEPGSGKTSFCQIWAARVAQELYPNWMPAIVHLKDASLGQTLEQTLESAFPLARFTDTDGWLSGNSPPCLLILDGLDELLRSPHTERHLWTFMEQVMRFHTQNRSSAGFGRHKIVITSRGATVEDLIRKYQQSRTLRLPNQLERIAIEPMGQEEFRQWFGGWAKLQSKAIAQAYFNFLRHGGVFKQPPEPQGLASLLTRPLMLYLVGTLHRDAWVDESIFQTRVPQVKFEIYDRICRWLLGEPAAGSGRLPELIREGLAHASRSQEAIANLLKGRYPQQLRQQMRVAALKIIQIGQYQVPQAILQRSLSEEVTADVLPSPLPPFFFRFQPPEMVEEGLLGIRERRRQDLTLPPHLSPQTPVTSGVSPLVANSPFPAHRLEFSHLSLGEYLAAEEIAAQLQAITEQVQDQYGEVDFVINSLVNVARHLYALLGYGLLSAEITELVIERLRVAQKCNPDVFSFAVLFERLYRFYRAYCRGRWLDEGIAQQAHSQLQALHNPLNVLQIDAAVGLNVFLLLCSGAREAQIPFWPCGNPDNPEEFDADRLLSFINRTAALSPTAFWQGARQSLTKVQLAAACLNQVMLAEANFEQANLSRAELIGINLAGANLQNADLSLANLAGANLSNANLTGARLEGADLSGANLKGTNLTSANLTSTCLFETLLDEQSKNFATRSGSIFSLGEFQAYIESLVPPQISSNFEDDELLEGEPTIFIESAEGELMLPDERYGNELDYYDGETAQIEEPEREIPIVSNAWHEPDEIDETLRLSDLELNDI